MKINSEQLKNLVEKMLEEKVKQIKAKKLNESNDFTAKRQIVSAAAQAAMNFENEIIKLLKLVSPDDLEQHQQATYLEIVNDMKSQMTGAVAEAVNKLSTFPRTTDGNSDNNQK